MGNFDWGFCSDANMSTDCGSSEATTSVTQSVTTTVEETPATTTIESTMVVTETGLPIADDAAFTVTVDGVTQSISTEDGDTMYLSGVTQGSDVDAPAVDYHGLTYYPTVDYNSDGSATVNYAPSAQVLIVTNGQALGTSGNLQSAISQYQASLQQQGLTSAVVDISSPDYTALTGQPAVTASQYGVSQQAIQNLEQTAGGTTQYLVILGSQNAMPMQTTSVAGEGNVNPASYGYNPSGNPSTIYTDQGYGSSTIAVSRVPGSTPDEVAQVIQSGLSFEEDSQQSLTSSYNPSLVTVPDSDQLRNANLVSESITGQPCSGNSNCLVYTSAAAASSSGSLTNIAQDPDNLVQIYNGHGNGVALGSNQGNPMVLTTQTVPDVSDTNPIIIMDSCYGGVLPGQGSSTSAQSSPTIASQFLDNGASAYIGFTSEVTTHSSGLTGLVQSVTGTGPESDITSYFYSQLSSGQTVGQAFQNTQSYFSTSSNPDVQQTLKSMVLYGIPTLQPFRSH